VVHPYPASLDVGLELQSTRQLLRRSELSDRTRSLIVVDGNYQDAGFDVCLDPQFPARSGRLIVIDADCSTRPVPNPDASLDLGLDLEARFADRLRLRD
jgi:hypothetical protein